MYGAYEVRADNLLSQCSLFPSTPNLIAPFTIRNPPMWVEPTLHSTVSSTNERTSRFHKKKLPALSSFQRYTCPFSDTGTSFWYSSASSCSSPNHIWSFSIVAHLPAPAIIKVSRKPFDAGIYSRGPRRLSSEDRQREREREKKK